MTHRGELGLDSMTRVERFYDKLFSVIGRSVKRLGEKRVLAVTWILVALAIVACAANIFTTPYVCFKPDGYGTPCQQISDSYSTETLWQHLYLSWSGQHK